MARDEGTGTRPQKKKPPPDAVRFGADVGLFTPPALVPPPREVNPDRDKVPRPFPIKPTPQQERVAREAASGRATATRTREALKAPVDVGSRIRVRRGETAAERKVRTTVMPRKRTLEEISKTQETALSSATMKGLVWLNDTAADPLGKAITKVLIRQNELLGELNQPLVDVISGAPDTPLPKGKREQAGLLPVDLIRNFASGTGKIIAGAPYGLALTAKDPVGVLEDTISQYDDYYYTPLRKGDWKTFRENLMKMPEQAFFDALALLSLGAGAAVRVSALKATVRASPEELAGIRRGYAIAQSILWQKRPWSINDPDGNAPIRLFGRKPVIRTEKVTNKETGSVSEIQRTVPQGAFAVAVGDVLEGMRIPARARSRAQKFLREQWEQQGLRSRAELSLFARIIRDYQPSVLDRLADRLGVSGRGRLGLVARNLDEGRVAAAHALAAALDAVGMGGNLERAAIVIANDLTNLRGRLAESPGNRTLQNRIATNQHALRLLEQMVEEPDTPFAQRFAADVEATRALSQEVEQTLIDHGLLNPDTAERVLDRQWRDAQVLQSVENSAMRDQLEDVLTDLWGDDEAGIQRVGHALQLLDAEALSFAQRTGRDPADFYDDSIQKVMAVDEVPEAALKQLDESQFQRVVDPDTAAANLRAFQSPRFPGSGDAKNPAGPDPRTISVHGHKVVGPISPEEYVARLEVAVPDKAMRDDLARWYEHFGPVFRTFFGEWAEPIMRGFSVSQANASPAGGLLNVFRVMDRIERGIPVSNAEISTVAESIAMAVQGLPVTKGLQAKLHDFVDSLLQRDTRTWVGDAPPEIGGSPTAIDIHAQRDLGRIDPKILATLADRHGLPVRHLQVDFMEKELGRLQRAGDEKKAANLAKKLAEFKKTYRDEIKDHRRQGLVMDNPSSSASGESYNAALREYRVITDYMNEIEFDGRGDWTTAQVQALGWSAIQRYHGVTPEDLVFAVDRNTYRISLEVVTGKEGYNFGLQPRNYREMEQATKAAEDVVRQAIDEEPVLFLRNLEYGPSGTGDTLTPEMQIDVIGSPEAAANVARRLARVFDKWEVTQIRPGVTGKYSRVALELESPGFRSRKRMEAFWSLLREAADEAQLENLTSFSPYTYTLDGRRYHGMRIITTHPSVSPAERPNVERRYADLLATVVAQVDHDVTWDLNNVEVRRHDGTADEEGAAGAGASGEPAADPLAAEAERRVAATTPREVVLLQEDYRGSHRAPRRDGYSAPLHDLTALYPEDVYDPSTQVRFYGGGDWLAVADRESFEVVNRVRGNPDAEVVLYRAVPSTVGEINPGDWVTPSRAYAEQHAESNGERDWRVIQITVPARDVFTDANSINEFGWDPDPLMSQWDPSPWYGTGSLQRPPRGGALVRHDGTTIFLTPNSDITTVIHEVSHAALPEMIGWLVDHDPELADHIGGLLGIGGDGIIGPVAQEVFAYAHDVWVGMGRPTVTQLRDAWEAFGAEKVQGKYKAVPVEIDGEQIRARVKKALEDPDFATLISDLNDPLTGWKAHDGVFHIPRRPPAVRNPFAVLRAKSGLTAVRSPIKESRGILHESGRDVLGPVPVLEAAERTQRYVEQKRKLEWVKQTQARPFPLDEDGHYDFTAIPPGHVPFNPDGLRGWLRRENEAQARSLLAWDEEVPIDEIYDAMPLDVAEEAHRAAMQIANEVFPAGRMVRDPREGELYLVEDWVKQSFASDNARAFTDGAVNRGLQVGVDVIKSLHALQRLRMFMSLRYVLVNVGGTESLNVMHQGVFHAFNLVEAVKIAHGNPALWARLGAEVGKGYYDAFDIDTARRPVISTIEAVAEKVGQTVSKPESFLRVTSVIHQLRRAGFRDEHSITRLLDMARDGNTEATAYLNQISRWAEEDVIRFRGLPPLEKEWLRTLFFVSGWLVAATRFTLRYPMNHPFWTTALYQVGDDGWNEMRKRLLEFTEQTKSMVVTGKGRSGTRETVSMVDPGTLLPFGVADQTISTLLNIGTLGQLGSERTAASNFNAGFTLIDAMLHGGQTQFGKLTTQLALDQFIVSGTPLDYIADTFPGAFRWSAHERTPSSQRVDQSMKEYALEWMAGRMYPTRYYTDEIRERWAKSQSSGDRAAARARRWADQVEATHGQPPDEAAYAAKATMFLWESQWRSKRAELESEGASREDLMRAEAKLKAKLMRDGGFIPKEQTFNEPTPEALLVVVDVYWDNTVGNLAHVANTAYPLSEVLPDG